MKSLGRTFVRGLLAVLPVALTAWVLWWLGSLLERTLGSLLKLVLPDEYYRPGFGLLAGAILIFLVGLLTHAWLVRQVIGFLERRIVRLPVIKSIYGTFRDFATFFRQEDQGDGLGRPVLLELNGMQLIGFVTSDDAKSLGKPGQLVVYLPLGYQIGGYTLVVPPDAVSPIAGLSTQEAMRYAMTAGITGASREQDDDSRDDG